MLLKEIAEGVHK